MLTWEEIKELECDMKNRQAYEREYRIRKTYDRLLPTVDKIYDVFSLYAWSNGCADIAKSGARKCWEHFVEENKGTVIEKWVLAMESAVCANELKQYFNDRIRNQKEIVYAN